jgi:Tol biopolymer transport system component
MAQPFDPKRLANSGPAVPIAEEEFEKDTAFLRAGFSASDNGVLVFQSAADASSRLAWFDVIGKELGQLPETGYKDPHLSPDGRFLAVASDDERNGKHFIRIYDLERGISTRLTGEGTDEFPTWTRDGKHIAYLTGGASGSSISINEVSADGSGHPRVLLEGGMMIPNDWSPDGHLVFMDFRNGPVHLSVYSSATREVTDLRPNGSSEAQFSPDGKWIAFVGLEGRAGPQIFVQPFPGPGGRIQVSTAGGAQARWSRDGKRIFYVQPDKKLIEVSFDSRTKSTGAMRVLFQTRIVAPNRVLFQYDVAQDGRFIINSFPSNNSAPLTLLSGWPSLVRSR